MGVLNNGKGNPDNHQENRQDHQKDGDRRHKRREELPHLRKTPMSSRHIEERRRVESVTSQQRLMDAINGTVLKPRERQVLLLKIFDDLSHNEIADRLNITEKTSQRLFSKAIRKIQDAL